MSSTPWGSDPNAPRQDGSTDGAPGTPRGSEPPSYGTYDPGSSPSYPTEPGGSASSYGEYGSGAQSPSHGGDQGNYGDRPYPAYQQQGAYGQQGAYPGYQGGAPQGKPPSRTGPVVALIIGLLMMFGGPIIGFVVGATQSLSGIVDTASDAQMVPNGGAVELPADVTRVVMSESTQSIENETQLTEMTCTVTGPTGSPVNVTPMTGEISDGVVAFGPTFSTTESGPHTVDCSPVSGDLLVSAPFEVGDLTQAATSVLIGLLAGFVGLIVTIVAIVMLVRASRRRRQMGY